MRDYPAIIDVEASGFGRGSYPIEVGLVMPDGSSFCTIICPHDEWQHWDPEAEALHGLSRALLQKSGRSVRDTALILNEWLSGQVIYSDAWGNDSSWLALLFYYAGVPQNFKLESLRSLLSEDQAEIWHRVKDQVIAESDFPRHRASNDAHILQRSYVQSLELSRRKAI